ncbi:MAG: EamA family transporter [Pyrinomonadaceae bacterium]
MGQIEHQVGLKSNTGGRPSPLLVVAAFAAVYLIWGSTYLAIRVGVETLPPFLMAGAGFLAAGGVLYIWARARGAASPEHRDWRAALVTGTALLLVGNGLVFWAEQFVASGVTALLIATEPLWVVTLNWALPGGERPGGRTFAGLAVGFVGVLLLVGAAAAGGAVAPLGAGALVVAALSWAAGSLYSARVEGSVSPPLAAGMQMLVGGALLVVASGILGEWTTFDAGSVSSRSLLAWGYLLVFGSLVGFTAYIWLLKNVTPERASTHAYVNPVVAVLLGWAVAGEQMTPRTLAAAAVIVGAVVITISGKKAKSQREDEHGSDARGQRNDDGNYASGFVPQRRVETTE